MPLKIYLLGQFKLLANDTPFDLPSRPAQSLLAFLALNAGTVQRREKLASMLWPDTTESNARSYLRQALWRIRKAFEAHSLPCEDYLDITDILMTFKHQSDHWLDVDAVLKTTKDQSIEQIAENLQHYQGELLPGFYDEWILPERERLQAAFHQKMTLLLDKLTDAKKWNEAIDWSEHWIRHGFTPESAFRALMKAYAGLGDRGMVTATYQRCEKALEEDLDVKPSMETQHLYHRLCRDDILALEEKMPEADPPVIPTDFFAGKTPMPFELSVFVARETELARLNIFLDQVQKGAGKNVFITGDAGSGKTSLITEFIRLAQEAQPNLIVASGTCNAQTGMGDPYLPFREILELLTGDIKARWDAGAISESHARSLWENVPTTAKALVENGSDLIDTLLPGAALLERAQAHYTEPVEWYQRLSELVSERKSNPYLPHPHQSTYFEQYTRVLQTISRQNPLVLVIDDLQWADLGSISLLFHLGRHLSGYPIMVIGAYRPEEVTISRNEDRHPLVPVVRELQRIHGDITINLDQAENREFIEAYLDSEPNHLKQAFRDMLFRQTRGHPLFVIEFLQGLQERGDLIQDEDGFWTEGENLDWETLPARVEAVITERIDRLSPGMQKALYIASVEGDQFTAEVISKILSASKQDFLSQLSNDIDRKHRLIKAQSIQRIDGQMLSCYRFRHIQIQKFLYSNLDQVERAHFHEKIGRTLEELYHVKESITHPADLSYSVTPIVQLAHHFEKAGLINKAVKYLHLAGEKAVQLSAYQDANIHLNKGLELLKLLPESPERLSLELSLLLALGKTMKGLKGMAPPEVEKFFTRAHYLSQQVGDLQQRCLIMGELSIIYFVRADFQRSKEFAEETIRMSKEANDPMLIALSHWQMGFVLFTLGEYAKSREHLAKILSEYDPLEYHNQFIFYKGTNVALSAMTYDACCLWCLGYPEQAVQKSKRALEIAEHLNHPFTSAEVFTIAGCILNEMRGDAEGIVKNTDMLMELSDRVGLGWIGAGWLHRGAGLAMLGQIKEGVANSKKGLRKEYSRAAKCFQSLPMADIAYGKAKTGEFKDGLEDINDAIKEMSARKEFYGEPEIYRLKGEILYIQGDEDEAEVFFKKALNIAQHQGAKSWELRAALSLGKLWSSRGELKQAIQLLTPIYDWFTEGFDTPDLVEAQAFLKQAQETR